jgi:soluble lytic murein transglycosylase-like protein
MKEQNINPLNLKEYAAGIAAAATIALASQYQPQEKIPSLVPHVEVIETSELAGLTDDQKADLVWKRYGYVIKRSATKYDLDPDLIFATIMVESGGNTYAVRHEPYIGDASYGLGQMLYGTARSIGFEGTPDDMFDPEVNIELIAMYHARNKAVYGDLTDEQLTIAYNAGSPYSYPLPGHLDKFNKWYTKARSYTG